MAVHGALTGSVDVAPGVLAAIRDLVMHVDRLDDVADDLIVAAEKLWGEGTQLLYGFTISAGTRELLQGRATVMLTR
jgi:predicted hotdog family 3-hydroxylacyl-ACP dehydratase